MCTDTSLEEYLVSPRHGYWFRTQDSEKKKIKDRIKELRTSGKMERDEPIIINIEDDFVELHDGNASLVAWLIYAMEQEIPLRFENMARSFKSVVVLRNRMYYKENAKLVPWHPIVPKEIGDQIGDRKKDLPSAGSGGLIAAKNASDGNWEHRQPIYFNDPNYFFGEGASVPLGKLAREIALSLRYDNSTMVWGLGHCNEEIRNKILNTEIGNILLMPPIADHLREQDDENVWKQQVGSWVFSLRLGRSQNKELLDCLPRNPEDGFQLSYCKTDSEVQLHDGNHRMVALFQEVPRLRIGDLSRVIKFIHCGEIQENERKYLKNTRGFEISAEKNEICYWFPAKQGEKGETFEDPGHDYEEIKNIYVYRATASPPCYRKRWKETAMTKIRDVPKIDAKFIRPRQVVSGTIHRPTEKSREFAVVGDFTRWTFRPRSFSPHEDQMVINNLKPNHSYRYKFFNPKTKKYFARNHVELDEKGNELLRTSRWVDPWAQYAT